MTSEKAMDDSAKVDDADFAKALQELAKGERTATALESQLSAMEEKIEALLAQAEKDKDEMESKAQTKAGASSNEEAAKEK